MTHYPKAADPLPLDVASINGSFVAAFQAQDAHSIAHHYTEQGWLLLSHGEIITGQNAIRAFWQGILDMGLCCTERATVEWMGAATFANEIGTYVLRHHNGQLADHGTYVALWQWSGVRWLIHHEVWRSTLRG
ncbi:MAG: hypothetical protein R3A44_11515 [Caldilineaceae bacterium]